MKTSIDKSPVWLRGIQIGLGIITVVLSIYALAFPTVTLLALIVILAVILFIVGIETIITVFVGICLIFNGCARIVEGISGRHSGWAKFFLIGVGILSIVIGTFVLASPIFGAVFVGLIIAIGLLITGIQMIAVGAAGKSIIPDSPSTTHV